jgi:hypothetical protein
LHRQGTYSRLIQSVLWILFMLSISVKGSYAQNPTWSQPSYNANQHQFNFTSNKFIQQNGQTLVVRANDAIAVFAKSAKVDKCVGYKVLIGSDTISWSVFAYTDSSGKFGDTLATFYLRYWDAQKQCELTLTDTAKIRTLKVGTVSTIYKAEAPSYTVQYASNSYYKGGANPSPTISAGLSGLSYSSIGLKINRLTGQITLDSNTAGTYQVQIVSSQCLVSANPITLTILPAQADNFDISKLNYALLSPGCKTLGSLQINTKSIVGKKPFVFRLTNTSNAETVTNTSGIFEVKEGVYSIAIRDSTGKEATFSNPINVIGKEDCFKNPLLIPDSKDGQQQTIFIPEAGMAKILDKEGKVIRNIQVPAEWDGTDSKGSPVPMGDYYLFIDEQQNKVITVIR